MNTEEIKAIAIRDVIDKLGISYTGAGTNEFTLVE